MGPEKSPSDRLGHVLGWIQVWMGVFHSPSDELPTQRIAGATVTAIVPVARSPGAEL
jgi:hypothetical protein